MASDIDSCDLPRLGSFKMEISLVGGLVTRRGLELALEVMASLVHWSRRGKKAETPE